ncbi:MAG: hypothetical protein KJ779_00750, partial [Firmicutes bacterium]|nr:hypothetical protein [Bacillota bacterium]
AYGSINNRELVIYTIRDLIIVLDNLDNIMYENVKRYAKNIISTVVAKMEIELAEIDSGFGRLDDDQL